MESKDIPNFDVLLEDVPCQPFSISGKKKGVGDTRGLYFLIYAESLMKNNQKLFFYKM